MHWFSDVLSVAALSVSMWAAVTAFKANRRAERDAVPPLAYMREDQNIVLLNTGERVILNLEWKCEGGHVAKPLLAPGERWAVGGFTYLLSREKQNQLDFAYTCEYPAGSVWEVRLLPPIDAPLLQTSRRRLN